MAVLTPDIIKIVQDSKLSEDIQQEFFARWLELEDEKIKAVDFEHLTNIVKARLSQLVTNTRIIESNRARLREENDETIRKLYGYNDVADNPLEVILAEELQDEIMDGLSELEKEIYARVIGNGVPYKDVADELKMSEEAIRKHVSRIKGKFNGKTN